MVDDLYLQLEQQQLLSELIERERCVPREERTGFMFVQPAGETRGFIHGPGSDTWALYVDIVALADSGLISVLRSRNGYIDTFCITGKGYAYNEQVTNKSTKPLQQVERDVLYFICAEGFRRRHAGAYLAWIEAAELLRASDGQHHLVEIGHHCREALRSFSDSLANIYRPPELATARTPTARIRKVIEHQRDQLGSTLGFINALIEYFSQVWKLANRQEHGSEKVGDALSWEDARRLVFQTAMIMFEVDRSLNNTTANDRYFIVQYEGYADRFHAYKGAPVTLPGEEVELSEAQIRALLKQGHRLGGLPSEF